MQAGPPSPVPIRKCKQASLPSPAIRRERLRQPFTTARDLRNAPRLSAMAATAHPDRNFKYWLISPAIFLLLLIGLFPLIFSLVVSFMRVTMLETDTSFAGLVNFVQLFHDARLWQSFVHTALVIVIALPIELLLGLAIAYLFLDRMPGRQILVSLLMLPTIISPIVAGATWRLLFDNR